MATASWDDFDKAREEFRNGIQCMSKRLSKSSPKLIDLQQELADLAGTPYTVKRSVVYNTDLDKINPAEIKLILVADNPGQKEQANERYLDPDGASGTAAENFLVKKSPLYEIREFRKNVLVLNKTPIHTPGTGGLSDLCRREKKMGGHAIKDELTKSQEFMARLLFAFQKSLPKNVPVWIVGSSKLNSLFKPFTKTLCDLYKDEPKLREDVLIFNHFSFGGFSKDLLKENAEWKFLPTGELMQLLKKIGSKRRDGILVPYSRFKQKPTA